MDIPLWLWYHLVARKIKKERKSSWNWKREKKETIRRRRKGNQKNRARRREKIEIRVLGSTTSLKTLSRSRSIAQGTVKSTQDHARRRKIENCKRCRWTPFSLHLQTTRNQPYRRTESPSGTQTTLSNWKVQKESRRNSEAVHWWNRLSARTLCGE